MRRTFSIFSSRVSSEGDLDLAEGSVPPYIVLISDVQNEGNRVRISPVNPDLGA